MSTVKVNEVKHLSNTGTANIVLESNATTNLQATSTLGLTVTGTLTVSGVSTFNGNTIVGNASTDTMLLNSTVSGFNNFSGFTGEIRMYAGNAAGDAPPAGWLYCNGDTISSVSGDGGTHYNLDGKGNDYQPLFNLLKASSDWGNSSSSSWGADTVKTPDFRSRSPVGSHTGAATSITAGLTSRTLSDAVGTETHSLTIAELAVHTHVTTAADSPANSNITVSQASHTHPSTAHSHTSDIHDHAFGSIAVAVHPTHNHQIYVQGGTNVNTVSGPGDGFGGAGGAMHNYNTVGHTSGDDSGGRGHTVSGSTASTTPDPTGTTTPPDTGASSSDTVTLGGQVHTHVMTSANAAHSGTSAAGTAHTILQPIIAVNYIIKV